MCFWIHQSYSEKRKGLTGEIPLDHLWKSKPQLLVSRVELEKTVSSHLEIQALGIGLKG